MWKEKTEMDWTEPQIEEWERCTRGHGKRITREDVQVTSRNTAFFNELDI